MKNASPEITTLNRKNLLKMKKDDFKLYYSIGEVAEMLGLTKSQIRFWDAEFSILKPVKNSKGDRRFTKKNIEQLQLIQHLVKQKGYTLRGAKKYLKENRELIVKKRKTINSLESVRGFLENLRGDL